MTSNTSLRERVVLVTGSSSGIGRAIAVAYGRERACVAVTYCSNRDGGERTAELVREAGGAAHVVRYDMTERDSVESAVDDVLDRWGTIDVLVNNAVPADVRPSPVEAMSDGDWSRMVHGVQDGVFHTIRAAVPAMRSGDWGRIVTVSSTAAEGGPSGLTAYATAKSGLHGLSATLAEELGEDGILTNVVMPGFVRTEENLEYVSKADRDEIRERTPSNRLTTPEDVADLVLFLGSPANGNVTGEAVTLSGGV